MRAGRFSPAWGDLVRRLREARGWSQEELARRAGLDQSRVSKIEKGEQILARLPTLAGLADALDVSIDFLVGREVRGESLADRYERLAAEARALEAERAGEPPASGNPGRPASVNRRLANSGAARAAIAALGA